MYKILQSSFLGNPIKKNGSYHIIGGGISGLMTGFFLKQADIPFHIFEKESTAGGLLKSHKTEFGHVEQAANGYLWSPALQQICNTLGLKTIRPNPKSKKRFLVRRMQLRQFPLGPLETLGFAGKLITPHSKPVNTVEEFGKQFFGKAFTNQVLEAAIAGIYGAKISELSFPGALAIIAEKLNVSNNILLAFRKTRKKTEGKISGTISFATGMSELSQGLSSYLSEHLTYNTNGFEVDHSDKQIILTTPSRISKTFFPEGSGLFKMLDKIEYTSIITTTLFFEKTALDRYKAGFGCLIPRSEGLNLLGVLFNSDTFPDKTFSNDHVSLTCIFRQEADATIDWLKAPDAQIVNMLHEELDKLFGVKQAALDYRIFKWPFGIPKYTPELYKNWFEMDQSLKSYFPNVNLFGNYTGQISLRGMANHIQSAVNL